MEKIFIIGLAMKDAIIERLKGSFNETRVGKINDGTAILGTTIGLIRKENEDRAVIVKLNSTTSNKVVCCYLISDGMGGMAEGAIAATITVSVFVTSLQRHLESSPDLSTSISCAIQDSNDAVYKKLKGKGGATLTGIIIDDEMNFRLINIGDSRAYKIFKNSPFKQLTKDDDIKSFLNEMDNLNINKELSKRNGLTKYIGIGEDLTCDVQELKPEGQYLIATDGLYRIGNHYLEELYKNSPTNYQFMHRSITTSNWLGGHDNATAILIDTDNFTSDFFSLNEESDYIGIWDFSGFYKFVLESVTIEGDEKEATKSIKKNKRVKKQIQTGGNIEELDSLNKDTSSIVQFSLTQEDNQGSGD
jgi:serine/threonine protein phosphatase PrpC